MSAPAWNRTRWLAIFAVPLVILTGFSATAAGVIAPTGRLPTAPSTFHTYASLLTELQNLSRSYPSLLTVSSIGASWETLQGLANRSLFAAEVSTGGTKQDILFMGLHHADEWISLEVVVYLLRYVLLNAGNDSRVDAILARANLWFVPLVNPDGFEYARLNDSLWRKNRRDNGDGTFGVDLNRNYGYMWGSGGFGTSTNDSEYRGTGPFSEPESQAIRDLALAHPPVLSISYHSAGQWVLYPWSYTRLPTADDDRLSNFAIEMAVANGYQVLQEGRATHVNPGNSDDWLYGTLGTAPFTFEVGLDFNSQNARSIGAVDRNNVEPALRGAEMALGLRNWRFDMGRVTPAALVAVAAVGGLSSVYFVVRWRRVRRDNPVADAR
ncbi:MAG TPA: M14 family metallopeptidase [Thermoplasmata archaeon]|nr:M14 family metallopeptidase [Thermoplasmata archaeon]